MKRDKEAEQAAWTLVTRDNMEIRESHPIAYRWARAYLDDTRTHDATRRNPPAKGYRRTDTGRL